MSAKIVFVELGQRVALKKGHPCGSNEWEVIRVGADIGLLCGSCGRKIMLARSEFDRRFANYL